MNSEQIKRAGIHHFVYKGEKYRIRTIISSVEKESRNELIGKSFLAVDLDQDKIIDQIQLGDIKINEAQEIYDYCLNSLAKDNKLKQIERQVDHYFMSTISFDLEIVTYNFENSDTFNKFRFTDKRIPGGHINHVFLDQKANGILDEKLKGTMSLADAQEQYTKFIERGLKTGELIKPDQKVLVRTK